MTPWLQDADVTLYHGDVLAVLRELLAESVDCCVTSPPYWGLRDYGQEGQLGLEPTPEEYVTRMVEVFREVRRVLTPHGTVWLNLGDSFAGHNLPGWRPGNEDKNTGVSNKNGVGYVPGLKPKDLVGIPWRVAFALQADGWYLRSDIIWAKPNPMPESVTDRPTKAHEYVFLLSKQPRYFFDQEAVREKYEMRPQNRFTARADHPKGDEGRPAHRRPEGFAVGPDGRRKTTVQGADGSIQHRDGERWPNGGRNIRSVWEIATQPYPEAHFATFPEELARRCIAAGTSERGKCPECGAPRIRVTHSKPDLNRPQAKRALEIAEREGLTEEHIDALRACGISDVGKCLVTTNGTGKNDPAVQRLANEAREKLGGYAREFLIRGTTETLRWRPSCDHWALENANAAPCVVLDPFIGSGTVAHVARKLGRHAVGIDLNESYLELAARRLQQQSLFAEGVA